MKNLKKISTYLLILVIWIMATFSVSAATQVKDGLDITVETDKQKYETNEKITAWITVRNTNSFGVDNVSLQCAIPAGYKAEGNSTLTIPTLASWEQKTLMVVLAPNASGSPATGDSSNMLLWSLIAALAAGAMGILCLRLRRNRSSMLAFVLCAAMVLSSLSMGKLEVKAAEATDSVAVQHIVEVGSKQLTIEGVVSYNTIKTVEEADDSNNETGESGESGEAGGDNGESGESGEAGGDNGESGEAGGESGEAGGDSGESGEAGGDSGESGEAGGDSGESGEAGGESGESGEAGGDNGESGESGDNGDSGEPGDGEVSGGNAGGDSGEPGDGEVSGGNAGGDSGEPGDGEVSGGNAGDGGETGDNNDSSDETTAEAQIKALKSQSETLTDDEITDAIQTLTDKRIAEIRNTPTAVEVSGTKYYVATDGDDANDGLSPETPWKTIARVNDAADKLQQGDGVFFKRGDLFEGTLIAKAYVTYSAYGEGEKPRLYASTENSADPDFWKETTVEGVWEYAGNITLVAEDINTKKPTYDIGNIVFDGISNARKIYVSNEKDGTHLDYYAKREFDSIEDFVDDLSFWYDSANGKLYLMCKAGNPGSIYEEIRLVPKASAIKVGKQINGVMVDNLHLAYSNYGVAADTVDDLTVQNCEINWIGGCIMVAPGVYDSDRTYPTPHGNGIEIYGNNKNFTVDNCYLWQIYDAAVTGQGEASLSTAENTQFINNVIEDSTYAIEVFYKGSKEGSYFKNTSIENNILRTAGGGFARYARPDQNVEALIRNGKIKTPTVEDYIVKNNIFDRSTRRIIRAQASDGGNKAMYYDNIYVQVRDYMFASRFGTEYYANDTLEESLVATGTEFNPTFVFVDELGY